MVSTQSGKYIRILNFDTILYHFHHHSKKGKVAKYHNCVRIKHLHGVLVQVIRSVDFLLLL